MTDAPTNNGESGLSIAITRRGVLVARPVAALALLLSLSACSLPVFFRVPIVQGNIVTAQQVDELKSGMTKKQVAYILGTPLIKAPFQQDEWDYVFYYRNPQAHVRQSRLDLFFQNGRLDHISGDDEYEAAVAKFGQQSGATENQPLPGAVSTPGAPLGVEQSTDQTSDNTPPNASGLIPHSHTSRPDSSLDSLSHSVPRDDINRPTSITNGGEEPPLPGRPGL